MRRQLKSRKDAVYKKINHDLKVSRNFLMTNSNKITYIANSQFPNQSANNIHIFNMAKAMHEAGF